MAISELSTSLICLLFLFFIFPNPASSIEASSSYADTICEPTPYPEFCKSNLPSGDQGDIHDYARYFTKTSLSSSKSFLSSVLDHLQSGPDVSTARALQDCYTLSDLNVDFWSKVLEHINSTSSLSSWEEAQDLETLISATLTNHDTCSDSLQQATSSSSTSDINDLLSSLSNGARFYSISLSLFNRGWVNSTSTSRERKLISERKQHPWEQRVYELIRGRGRKLLQWAPPNNVQVNQTVVVNPDGSGNFTTITDAVNAAPNNTDGSNGFFVIHVVAGVYQEYVSIPKTKTYLMMIGDGINQTVITGNRSVVDGWTTFNSATFGN